MSVAIVILGAYIDRTFVPSEPLPAAEGNAQLIVFPSENGNSTSKKGSIFDLFGKAAVLRTKDDIDVQVNEERNAWGEQ